MVYTTAALVEAELRATTSFSTDTNPTLASVTTWIDEVTDIINNRSSMSFESTTATDYFTYDGGDLFLKKTPVLSITSLKYNNQANGETPNWATKTEGTDFTVYEDEGRIKIFTNQWKPLTGIDKNIEVKYTHGYSTVPGRVQELATKMVTDRVLSTLLSNNVDQRNDGGSISVGSINIVEPGNYGVSTYNQLKSDIVSLMDEVTHQDFKVHRYG